MWGPQFCVFHRLEKVFAANSPGSCLWNFNSFQTLKTLRNTIKCVSSANANQLSWKAFRAGKATQMAASGCDLGRILEAGEWRSRAFVKYIDESAIDGARLLDASVNSSGDEDAVDADILSMKAIEPPALPVL